MSVTIALWGGAVACGLCLSACVYLGPGTLGVFTGGRHSTDGWKDGALSVEVQRVPKAWDGRGRWSRVPFLDMPCSAQRSPLAPECQERTLGLPDDTATAG